jgi:outer membrane protein assembly factor BamE (lipoprotein component of BamABCDE complex)
MRRALTVMGAAALAASVFAGGCGGTSSQSTQPRTTRRQVEVTSTTPNSPPTVTTRAPNAPTVMLQEFSSIEQGMTLDQVTEIFGSPGEVDRAAHSDLTESRRWDGSPGSDGFAMIVFRDRVVFGKTQVGL